MNLPIYYRIDQWLLFIGLIGLFYIAEEVGYHLSRHIPLRVNDDDDAQVGTLLAAMLAMLGLLFAFTFGMAVSHYDSRRNAVVNEVAIAQTAYMRAQLLPDPYNAQARETLHQYARVQFEHALVGTDLVRRAEINTTIDGLHTQLWQIADAVSAVDAQSVAIGLFTESVNQIVEQHIRRGAAFNNRTPEVVVYLLITTTVITLLAIGYAMGIKQKRNWIQSMLLVFLITVTLIVILDLDIADRGMISINLDTVRELLSDMGMQ